MGAKHSTPQTVRIDNPENRMPIYITPSVVSRLEKSNNKSQAINEEHEKQQDKPIEEESQKQQKTECRNNFLDNSDNSVPDELSAKRFEEDWSKVKHLIPQSYDAINEDEFNRTYDNIANKLGITNIKMRETANTEIVQTRSKLIQCLRDNPHKMLKCATIAKEYREAVLREQLNRLDQFNENNNNEKNFKGCPN